MSLRSSWPTSGDLRYANERGGIQDLQEQFDLAASKKDLFVVTDFDDLSHQDFLKEKLSAYPIFAEGDGYVIYNLMK